MLKVKMPNQLTLRGLTKISPNERHEISTKLQIWCYKAKQDTKERL
jgi:hypothetical protein